MTVKEESKKWTKARLRDELLLLAEYTKAWDEFLISELGEVTYNDLCKQFALSELEKWLREMNMSESDIADFRQHMGDKDLPKN